jgi:hypothetical protein
MFPSPTKERPSMTLENNDRLGVPYITAEKLSFLATYGLELDDDDDEEEDKDGSSIGSGSQKRFRRPSGGTKLFKKAISQSSTTVTTPLGSPSASGKTSKLVGLVTKPRSGSVASPLSPVKRFERGSISRAHSSTLDTSNTTPGRARASTTSSNISRPAQFKDYSISSPTPKPSRRGYFDDNNASDDEASSISYYAPSAIFEEGDDNESPATTTTETSSDSRSSHAKHVGSSPFTPLSISTLDDPFIPHHDHHKVNMLPSTSADTDDSSSEKDFGPFTPPALPARPLGLDFLVPPPSSAPLLPPRQKSSRPPSEPIPPTPPAKDEVKRSSAPAPEESSIKSAEQEKVAVMLDDNVGDETITLMPTKEEARKLAADQKAALAQEKLVKKAEEMKRISDQKAAVAQEKLAKKAEESNRLQEQKDVLAQAKIVKKKEESKRILEERERKILMKSYDELEVERFLANFGKHVTNVRSSGVLVEDPANSTYWPKKEDWKHSETGKLNVPGYLVTYLFSVLGYIASGNSAHIQPSTSISTEDSLGATAEEPFRIAALRANAERLYMTALPMYEGTFASMRKVWRWDNKFTTALWSASYFSLWYRGLLMSGLFALMIWNVLSVRIFPPKPDAIRQMLREQHQRSRELQQAQKAKAEDVIQQAQLEETNDSTADTPAIIKKKTKYRLAADATRKYGKVATLLTSAMADVHERIKNFVMWKSVPATWRAISLLAVGMVASYFSTPWIMARLPGFALGICLFVIAPIAEHRPELLGVEWKNPFDFLLAGVPNDSQYAMQVLRTRAAAGEALTGDRDIADWMKAGTDDDDDDLDTLIPVIPGLGGVDGNTAVSTAVNSATAASSTSVDWKKWKSRVAKGRELAVAGSEVLSGQRPLQLPRIAGSDQPLQSQEAYTSKMMLGMAKGVNWGLGSIQDSSNRKLMQRRLEGDEIMSASDGVYWAVYNGSCGHVVITPDKLRFRSMFARKMSADPSSEEQVDVLDAQTGEVQVSQAQADAAVVRTLVDVKLENVVQLKKTKTVNVAIWGIDGLEVRSRGGKVFQFSSIVKRDEAFNRILALAPQYWNKM